MVDLSLFRAPCGPPAAGRKGERVAGDTPAPPAMGLRPRHPLLGHFSHGVAGGKKEARDTPGTPLRGHFRGGVARDAAPCRGFGGVPQKTFCFFCAFRRRRNAQKKQDRGRALCTPACATALYAFTFPNQRTTMMASYSKAASNAARSQLIDCQSSFGRLRRLGEGKETGHSSRVPSYPHLCLSIDTIKDTSR